MRITIEPTTGNIPNQHSVTVEVDNDELDLDETMRLIGNAVISYGFHKDNVREFWEQVAQGG